jgi:hypothetical protein
MDHLAEITSQAEADVQDYQALVASAEARLAAAQADVGAAREKLSEAQIVREWLLRRGEQPAGSSTAGQNGQSQPAMRFGRPVPDGPSKLDQIIDLLDEFGGALSNKEISNLLEKKGIKITPDQVRGLLKYETTKKSPLVITVPGSGVWRRTQHRAGGEG